MNTPAKRYVRKGIKGVRKLLSEDKAGWHIFVWDTNETEDFRYLMYSALTVDEIRDAFPGWTLWEYQGNGLYFKR